MGGVSDGMLGVLPGAPRRAQRAPPVPHPAGANQKALSSARHSLVRWQKLATLVRLAVHEVEKLAFAFPAQPTRWHVDRLAVPVQ